MSFTLHLLTIMATSIPHIMGYNLVFGRGKIFHFGPLGVSIVGAYAFFLTQIATGNYLFAFIVGLLLTSLLTSFLAWISVRMEPDGFGVLSIALHLAMLAVVLNWTSLTRGALGIPSITRPAFLQDDMVFSGVCIAFALLWVLLFWWADRGPLGRQLTALGEQHWCARSLGIQAFRVHLLTFLLYGIGALMTNVFYTWYVKLLHPSDFPFTYFVFMVTVIVAGKPGSVPGAFLSLILLTLLREGIRFVPLDPSVVGPLRLILFGVILLIAVWWRRDSLFPEQRSV